ncbi:Xaa-Pro dipeptidyl-peptidase [Candidatus Palauibacter polyketidifaciens]|uniref:Xaa-Pro dipeptidyl-peptidase n=1 Tax=Candidatus Palauibacter polyketidifaciens TaxID=3056740 RepID=UPI00139D2F77|nr:Xaa-Pro dipeptidyl-peptidase [Candidatus Palauibacter polyketidifaciens]MDE2719256.1 Xaa-Pro dipeptidyl-peptidase [Candidatus Palauibacter polyketidifaciens]MYE34885.1 Xaa-Pro dipeptidyl-peptidase [Gemmatimonadales bacterium]
MISARFATPAAALLAFVLLPAAVTAQAGLVIEDGQAQIVAAFADSSAWIRHELWVETGFDSDGDGRPDRVHLDVTRPAQTDGEGLRVPVIYETSPYYSGVAGIDFAHFWDLRQEVGGEAPPRDPFPATIRHIPSQPRISNSHVATWVPRGFAVVHSQSPGTGQSQGCPTVGGANESLAPKAVIDWLNGRTRGFTSVDGDEEVEAYWATGRVGMTGTSYNGTLPLAAATTGVEGLEAIIPIAPNTSYYHYYRSNGLVRSPGGYPGEDVDVLFDFIFSGFPEVRDYCLANVRDEMTARLDRVTGDYNDFWAGRDYLNHVDGVRAATLMSHAFNDWNVMPEHSHRIAMALGERGVPLQIYYHQGGHGGAPPLELMNRWFTRYVVGVENGVEEDPEAWIVREGDDRAEPTPYPSYPHPEADAVTLRPGGDGHWTGTLSLDDAGAGTGAIVDNFAFTGDQLAASEWSNHRLLYATPELREDVHLSGVATVRVRMSADAPAANLSVWLVSLPWTESGEINDNIITKGWADPANAGAEDIASPRAGASLAPGEFVDLEFALQPDDQIIPAGARIGLMIFSSDKFFTLHPDPGTTLTVDLGETRIALPVVGGAAALRRALGVPASE